MAYQATPRQCTSAVGPCGRNPKSTNFGQSGFIARTLANSKNRSGSPRSIAQKQSTRHHTTRHNSRGPTKLPPAIGDQPPMDLTGLVKDVLLLSKARSEVVAEQMTRCVVHEVRVTSVRQYYAGQHRTLYGMTEGYLWNPTTEQLGSYRAKHPPRDGGEEHPGRARLCGCP